MTEKKKVVIFAGCSGGGKTYMEKLLIENYPELFNKLNQVTTREMREGEVQGNPYLFIDKEEYDRISDSLFGRTEIKGNYYGTKLELDPNKFNTIILNRMGIEDFEKSFPMDGEIEWIVVMIDSKKPTLRNGRDNNFIMEERWSIMEKMNICIVNDPPNYKSVEEVKNKIISLFERLYSKKGE